MDGGDGSFLDLCACGRDLRAIIPTSSSLGFLGKRMDGPGHVRQDFRKSPSNVVTFPEETPWACFHHTEPETEARRGWLPLPRLHQPWWN